MYNRKQYVAQKVDHETYYSQFVTHQTRAAVIRAFGRNRLAQALAEDKHLNNVPLRGWDKLARTLPFNRAALSKANTDGVSLSDVVCIAKEAARQAVTS